jgi:hypothetical protein
MQHKLNKRYMLLCPNQGADYAHHITACPPGFENLTAYLNYIYVYCGYNHLNPYLFTVLLSIPFNKFPCLFVIFARHFGQVLVPWSSHFWMHSSWIRWPHWVETVFFSELNGSKHTGHFMFFLDAKLFFHFLFGNLEQINFVYPIWLWLAS